MTVELIHQTKQYKSTNQVILVVSNWDARTFSNSLDIKIKKRKMSEIHTSSKLIKPEGSRFRLKSLVPRTYLETSEMNRRMKLRTFLKDHSDIRFAA